jgi:hypothetical protein
MTATAIARHRLFLNIESPLVEGVAFYATFVRSAFQLGLVMPARRYAALSSWEPSSLQPLRSGIAPFEVGLPTGRVTHL